MAVARRLRGLNVLMLALAWLSASGWSEDSPSCDSEDGVDPGVLEPVVAPPGKSARLQVQVEKVRECYYAAKKQDGDEAVSRPRKLFEARGGAFVEISRVIDVDAAEKLALMQRCVEAWMPSKVEYRPFEESYGGNNCTYLGAVGLAVDPSLFASIVDVAAEAAEAAGWRPHPKHLGVRTIEYLSYQAGGELGFHSDSGSVYTLIVMLADTSKFTGGSLAIYPRALPGSQYVPYEGGDEATEEEEEMAERRQVRVRMPERFSGVLFDSNAQHGVDKIDSGQRTVLVIELWPYEHADDLTDLRPPEDNYKTMIRAPSLFTVPTTAY